LHSKIKLKRLLDRRDLWKVGIFKFDDINQVFSENWPLPTYLLGESGFRFARNYQSTIADPFLFVFENRLYLFYESKTDFSHGEIHVKHMREDGQWISSGVALSEEFHLSYPQVFLDHNQVYMIPEAAQSGKVLLYSAVKFPNQWRREAVLIDEPLRDPTLIKTEEGYFLLATTSDYQLRLFHSINLLKPFKETGLDLTKDKSISRCAGAIIKIGSKFIRPAQDCSRGYGKCITFRQIESISADKYLEKDTELSLSGFDYSWASEGHHHFSAAKYGDSIFIAVDGRAKDKNLNSLLLGWLKVLESFSWRAR